MIIQYLPAFLVGCILAQGRLDDKLLSLLPIAFWSIMLLASLLTILFVVSKELPLGSIYRKYPTYIVLVFLYSALRRIEFNLSIYLINLDRCSMGIYIVHHLLIWAFLFYCPQSQRLMNEHYILAPIIMLVTVFLASWGITYMVLKNKYIAKIIGT